LNGTLKGTYEHTLDTKGRMAFPHKLREKIGSNFIITIGQGCLIAYSIDEWDRFTESLRGLKDKKAAAAKRIVNLAVDAECDPQGRININKELQNYAGLTKDITVVGVINHAEIWDSDKYRSFCNSVTQEDIDELLSDFAF
jgi:MraZ protein